MVYILLDLLFVVIAFVLMAKDPRKTNTMWPVLLVVSLVLGIGPFVAFGYFMYHYGADKKANKSVEHTTYYPDGSYVVYKVEDTASAPSTGKMIFKIVGGVIGGLTIAFGLLIIGVVLLVTIAPSVVCGGNSKGC